MAYCRFSNGDVYLFETFEGGFECCACRLAPLGNTIFTGGLRWQEYVRLSDKAKEKGEKPGKVGFSPYDHCPDCDGEVCQSCWCPNCKGGGGKVECPNCTMHKNTLMKTAEEALEHLEEHRKAGHVVPEHAFDRLRDEIRASEE